MQSKNENYKIYAIPQALKSIATLEGSYDAIMSAGYTHQWFICFSYDAVGRKHTYTI